MFIEIVRGAVHEPGQFGVGAVTREHFAVFGFTRRAFSMASRWYSGTADIPTFEVDQLLATKLGALYQRRKGRDLFDLATGLADERSDAEWIVTAAEVNQVLPGHRVDPRCAGLRSGLRRRGR